MQKGVRARLAGPEHKTLTTADLMWGWVRQAQAEGEILYHDLWCSKAQNKRMYIGKPGFKNESG